MARYGKKLDNFDSVLLKEWDLQQRDVIKEHRTKSMEELKERVRSMPKFQATPKNEELLKARQRDFDEPVDPIQELVLNVSSEDQIVQNILNKVEKSGKFTEEDKEECSQLLVNHYKDVSLDEGLLRLERASVQNFETVEKREIPLGMKALYCTEETGLGKPASLRP